MIRDTAYWHRRRGLNLEQFGSNFFGTSQQLAQNQPWLDQFGEIDTPPIVSWMYEYGRFRRFTQSVWITLPPNIVAGELEAVLQVVLDRHDILRSNLEVVDGGYRLSTRPPGVVRAADILARKCGPAHGVAATDVCAVIDRIDPLAGAMVQALWYDVPRPGIGRLLLIVPHRMIDVVSWYVLAATMAEAWAQLGNPEQAALPGEYTTYRQWSRLLTARSHTYEVAAQRDYWLAQLAGPDPALGCRKLDPEGDTWASLRTTEIVTKSDTTRFVLDEVASAGTDIDVRDFLLTALTMTLLSWRRRRGDAPALNDKGVLLNLESHGRDDALFEGCGPGGAGIDTSLTVGWFTQIFPVRLGVGRTVDVDTARRDTGAARGLLRAVSKQIDAVPNNGLDYALLRHHRRDPDLLAACQPQVAFNYIGRLDLKTQTRRRDDVDQWPSSGRDQSYVSPWSLGTGSALNASSPAAPESDLPLRHVFDVSALVQGSAAGPQIVTYWRWSDRLTTDEEALELAVLWHDAITTLADAMARDPRH
ncbi:condensation domain-containing protein [Mycobacterium marinum]|uniref:condensation domain-containing protein n=1 Tax=Mycobacterium marinum TaxID=1781 RepID=UPI000B976409|nr:condensation domain-containing protein [Mycobacterium marinum]MDC9014269.1 condensation domain-containing protein [Mycobacterium marinum]